MQVAGSASGTHKHDGDNTTECFKIISVDVVSGTMCEPPPKSTNRWHGTIELNTRVIIFTRKINIELPRQN
jgi:hypothetical protein